MRISPMASAALSALTLILVPTPPPPPPPPLPPPTAPAQQPPAPAQPPLQQPPAAFPQPQPGALSPAGPAQPAPAAAPAGPSDAAPAAPNPPGGQGYTLHSDVRVTMDDGASLDTDEYIPDSGCPCPVILIQTPYRKQGGVPEANTYFPRHGYAEIVVDVRGTGSSEGYWDSFGPREQKDSVALVRYAASRPFSNGKLGLAGVSYSAINQFLTVEQPGTEAVKAIFPVVPGSDPYRDVTFAGGNTDSGFIPLWLGLVNTLAVTPAQDTATQPAVALNAESQHLYDLTHFAAPVLADSTTGRYERQLPSQIQTYPDQAYDGPFYQVRAPITKIRNVRTPTFIVGGLWDLFQRGEPILYNGLQLPNSQKKLLIGPWYHDNGSSAQGLTADDGSNPVRDDAGRVIPSLNNLQLQWFDHWLKGIPNGADTQPNVEQYHQGANRWIQQTGYPAPGTRYQPFYLAPGGALSTSRPAASGSVPLSNTTLNGLCSRSTSQWTSGADGLVLPQGQPCSNDNRLTEAQGITFTTPPLPKPARISGPINARLFVSSTRPDATVIATLTDVAPDGGSNQMTAGTLLLSQRKLTAAHCGSVVLNCSVYSGGQVAEPWHPYTRDAQQPLQPDQVYEVQIEVFPTSAILQPGHSLRLVLTSSDVPHQSPSLSTAVDQTGGVTTFHFGGRTPSWIYVGL